MALAARAAELVAAAVRAAMVEEVLAAAVSVAKVEEVQAAAAVRVAAVAVEGRREQAVDSRGASYSRCSRGQMCSRRR